MCAMDWVNLSAPTVNEENAAGHRVVTTPTDGAAGVVPAVLGYLVTHRPETGSAPGAAAGPDMRDGSITPFSHIRLTDSHAGTTHEDCDSGGEETFRERRRTLVRDFLFAVTAIGALTRTNASITGAEIGCQGEVNSAPAMAATGLARVLGENPQQVENVAETTIEHPLGFTCDSVVRLVQVPCTEHNAVAAVKAISAARTALQGNGRHIVSLDAVIETMYQTGSDVLSKYKETSGGGLTVNVVEC